MPNRLIHENSPYLLQHAHNPVDWYPWGPEALDLARRENKPIFLSIGYSACHWCHVMAHESFEDPQLARLLAEHFVSVKVDREERPELDQVYMDAVQMMTGRGGWPLSAFLTPELEPFFGGTYWPPRARGGMPGFDQILRAVADAWQNRREQAVAQASRLAEVLRRQLHSEASAGGANLDDAPLRTTAAALHSTFDRQWGGFGTAPKFPQPVLLRLLLRRWQRTRQPQLLEMVAVTLDRMAAGGIYDHLGGGFHRYSVDARWLVPHFEKMLYDNALLAVCYLEAWQATGREPYAQVVRETLGYVLRDMTDPQGGFYTAEDADSQGREGEFYLWTPDQVRTALDASSARSFCCYYDVSEAGNFEGRNILYRSKTLAQAAQILGLQPAELDAQVSQSRLRLREVRAERARPARDDKVLVSWNGLMIEALACAGAALGHEPYLAAADRAADFLLAHLRRPDGRLRRYWRQGRAQGEAFLDDYAALANALTSLYEARSQQVRLDQATELADQILRRFGDARRGGFYYTAADQPLPLARRKDVLDSSIPSGTGLATLALLRLGRLCGRGDCLEAGRRALTEHADLLEQAGAAAGQMLLALDFCLGPAPSSCEDSTCPVPV